jgi:MFS superfamily molybdate transporter
MSEERAPQAAVPAVGVAARVNRFDRMEWAGAFGDLGTLIPLVVAYIGMVGMDPFGILFSFGVSLVVWGSITALPCRSSR